MSIHSINTYNSHSVSDNNPTSISGWANKILGDINNLLGEGSIVTPTAINALNGDMTNFARSINFQSGGTSYLPIIQNGPLSMVFNFLLSQFMQSNCNTYPHTFICAIPLNATAAKLIPVLSLSSDYLKQLGSDNDACNSVTINAWTSPPPPCPALSLFFQLINTPDLNSSFTNAILNSVIIHNNQTEGMLSIVFFLVSHYVDTAIKNTPDLNPNLIKTLEKSYAPIEQFIGSGIPPFSAQMWTNYTTALEAVYQALPNNPWLNGSSR